jgi:large conductance mechanosensitive channel
MAALSPCIGWADVEEGTPMLKDFREFALRGNVIDLAIGVIIGAAFGKIVDSMVADVIMPLIAGIFGTVDFSNLYASLGPQIAAGTSYADAKKAGAVLGYGQFLTYVVNFMIVAFVLFIVVKALNELQKRVTAEKAAEAPAAAPAADTVLLTEIRDLLAAKK